MHVLGSIKLNQADSIAADSVPVVTGSIHEACLPHSLCNVITWAQAWPEVCTLCSAASHAAAQSNCSPVPHLQRV